MRRFRLTKGAKVLILILVIALIGGGIFMGLKTGVVKNDLKPDVDGNVINTVKEARKPLLRRYWCDCRNIRQKCIGAPCAYTRATQKYVERINPYGYEWNRNERTQLYARAARYAEKAAGYAGDYQRPPYQGGDVGQAILHKS